MVIKLNEQGVPTGHPLVESNFKQLFPNTSFPAILFPADVEPFGYGMYEFSQQPELTNRYDKLVELPAARDQNGYWRQQWSIVEQTAEEKAQTDTRKAAQVRIERNRRLTNSDWTQMKDSPLSESKGAEWAVYRQQLRDITLQPGFPWEIQWPTTP